LRWFTSLAISIRRAALANAIAALLLLLAALCSSLSGSRLSSVSSRLSGLGFTLGLLVMLSYQGVKMEKEISMVGLWTIDNLDYSHRMK
jgi:hypothetical protein